MKRLVIIGGGFAGVWSAMSAAKKCQELNRENDLEIVLVSKDPYLNIRPRFYEKEIEPARVPLDQVLDPIGVKRVEGIVTGINFTEKSITINTGSEKDSISYDRIILAAGSSIRKLPVPGSENVFTVDTYAEATQLDQHIKQLHTLPNQSGKYTAVIIGAGFTGIEVATEMVSRLRGAKEYDEKAKDDEIRVVVVEHSPSILSSWGDAIDARSTVLQALSELGIEVRTNTSVTTVKKDEILLNGEEKIATATTIWSGGVQASKLTELFSVERDELGRLPVDNNLRVNGEENTYAAGDVARALTDEIHVSLTSCQHAIPQGQVAGHNAVADLFGYSSVSYHQKDYATCLDLGDWGALLTQGWEREIQATKSEAKKFKRQINEMLIYPPLSGDKNEILQAGSLSS
jgi:NADH dehydrogenase